ncbi:PRC-barrel domain-containing protein [Puniceibacterium confluentis]|uniref:PRC-barrel domain-containing protein n=1 Tax=Puniceibacterium confluentis TaxID=1958944 RepID=UPI00164663B4|nr:PRC-barrel domain-containing protein [Puniceibacterium confluentis]
MTLKDMMLGSAIAALVAGGAVAQTATPDAGVSAETAVEAQTSTDTNIGAGAAGLDSSAESTITGDADASAGTDATTGSVLAPESGTTVTGDVTTEMDESRTSLNQMTVDQVVGTDVIGIDDEEVGEIDYVVQQTDGLAFVIGIGGFLGLGEYTVAIPADQFSLNADGDLALSSMTKEELKTLPEFDEDGVEGLDGDLIIGDLMNS